MAQPQYLSILMNGLAAGGDILIAAALCTFLHLSRTGFKRWPPSTVRKAYTYLFIRSDTMIDRLVSGTTFPFASSFTSKMFRALQFLIALVLISDFTPYQMLFTINTGVVTRYPFNLYIPSATHPTHRILYYRFIITASVLSVLLSL